MKVEPRAAREFVPEIPADGAEPGDFDRVLSEKEIAEKELESEKAGDDAAPEPSAVALLAVLAPIQIPMEPMPSEVPGPPESGFDPEVVEPSPAQEPPIERAAEEPAAGEQADAELPRPSHAPGKDLAAEVVHEATSAREATPAGGAFPEPGVPPDAIVPSIVDRVRGALPARIAAEPTPAGVRAPPPVASIEALESPEVRGRLAPARAEIELGEGESRVLLSISATQHRVRVEAELGAAALVGPVRAHTAELREALRSHGLELVDLTASAHRDGGRHAGPSEERPSHSREPAPAEDDAPAAGVRVLA